MTVRAFRQQGSFEARNQALLDHSNRAYWPAQVGGLAWLEGRHAEQRGWWCMPGGLARRQSAPCQRCSNCLPSRASCPSFAPHCFTSNRPQCINRWLSVRLELLGIAVVFGTAVLVAVAAPRSAGLAGLALTSALSLTG